MTRAKVELLTEPKKVNDYRPNPRIHNKHALALESNDQNLLLELAQMSNSKIRIAVALNENTNLFILQHLMNDINDDVKRALAIRQDLTSGMYHYLYEKGGHIARSGLSTNSVIDNSIKLKLFKQEEDEQFFVSYHINLVAQKLDEELISEMIKSFEIFQYSYMLGDFLKKGWRQFTKEHKSLLEKCLPVERLGYNRASLFLTDKDISKSYKIKIIKHFLPNGWSNWMLKLVPEFKNFI